MREPRSLAQVLFDGHGILGLVSDRGFVSASAVSAALSARVVWIANNSPFYEKHHFYFSPLRDFKLSAAQRKPALSVDGLIPPETAFQKYHERKPRIAG
jgi:hypothetical protein